MPFTAAHTYIAHMWQYPPPLPPGWNPSMLTKYNSEHSRVKVSKRAPIVKQKAIKMRLISKK